MARPREASKGSGLVFITSSTFSTASSVNVNNCFSSIYRDYEIVITHICSANQNLFLRLRNAGSDYTASTYYAGMVSTGTDTTTVNGETSAAATSAYIGEVSDSRALTKFTISHPYESERKIFSGSTVRTRVTGPTGKLSTFGGFVNNTSTYDGITLFPGTGTITGSIQVYGYRK